jgi:hypothetical protein
MIRLPTAWPRPGKTPTRPVPTIRAGQDPIAAKQEQRRRERHERETRKAAREGRPAPGTFSDLAERYLRDARRRRRERSVREAERKLKVEVLPKWGMRAVAEIRRADVLRLIEEARERGGVCSNRTLALVRGVLTAQRSGEVLAHDGETCTEQRGRFGCGSSETKGLPL